MPYVMEAFLSFFLSFPWWNTKMYHLKPDLYQHLHWYVPIKLPHANLLTFHIILSINYHDNELQFK